MIKKSTKAVASVLCALTLSTSLGSGLVSMAATKSDVPQTATYTDLVKDFAKKIGRFALYTGVSVLGFLGLKQIHDKIYYNENNVYTGNMTERGALFDLIPENRNDYLTDVFDCNIPYKRLIKSDFWRCLLKWSRGVQGTCFTDRNFYNPIPISTALEDEGLHKEKKIIQTL